MLKRYVIAFVSLFLAVFQAHPQPVKLNEIMASNSQTLADEDGDFPDWIELYNGSSEEVRLAGYGLTDDPDLPFKWVFPEVMIQAGAFMVVWASGKDRTASILHTNFRISSSGEDIILTAPDSVLVDIVPATPIQTDISYGRKPDGTEEWHFFAEPTPGAANLSHAYLGVIPPLTFSHDAGFYAETFPLEISSTVEGATIYYTHDGSVPDDQDLVYASPLTISPRTGAPNQISMIPTNDIDDPGPPYFEGWQPPDGEVFKSHAIRAFASKEDYLSSSVTTMNYVVDDLGTDRYRLPVFFLNTDVANLFDPDIGVYFPGNHNNMFQRGSDWERPIHLSFFETDGALAFSQDLGLRLHGGTTRSRPRKSLRIYAREEYGYPWLAYSLFPEKDIGRYQRFLLRNSGNDWDQSVFRDGFMQYLARDLHVETQYYRPAILFVNGEYWGIHNIRDRYDASYLESHYGLDEHEVVAIENDAVFAYGNPDGVAHYNDMLSFIADNTMSDATNFEHVRTMMDMESFTDFQITHIYIMNTDWPGNNFNVFRRLTNAYDSLAGPGRDGRWRWMILDTDFGFGLNFFYVPGVGEGPAHNTLAMATDANGPGWPNPPWSTFLFRQLLTNESYQHAFINRFADLLNTTLSEQQVVTVLDSIENVLLPEMQEHINRWRRPVDLQEWLQNVAIMKDFGRRRAVFVRQHIQEHFQLEGQMTLQLKVGSPHMGKIRVNSITPDTGNGWEGIYFKGIPISLQAMPGPGFRFSHWSGHVNGEDESIEITPEGDSQLQAHFEPDPAFEGELLYPLLAYDLNQGSYLFDAWDENQPEGDFPPHMLFLQSSKNDPELEDEMTRQYHIPEGDYHEDDLAQAGFPYRLSRRTRINGLGSQGISFINTGRERDLGAAVLAIDTRGRDQIEVSWTGATMIPNARVYAIQLQYLVGVDGQFSNVTDSNGEPVTYMRSDVEGHEQRFGPVVLPAEANNKPYVQLRWKYYFTGEQLDADHGRRDMLRLDDIVVSGSEMVGDDLVLNVKMRVWRDYYGRFNPDEDYVDVAGSFNEWDGADYHLTRIAGDSDLTYTIAIPDLEPGMDYQFKFRVNGSWDDGMHDFPGGGPNRQITMQEGRNVHTYWFNDEDETTPVSTTGIPSVSIYPNPARESVTIESSDLIREVHLVNAMGQVVYMDRPGETRFIFPVNAFIPGLYVVKVYTDSGIPINQVLLIR